MDLLDKMRVFNVIPNVVMFTSIVTACGKAGRLDKALEVCVLVFFVCIYMVMWIVTACGKAGRLDKALECILCVYIYVYLDCAGWIRLWRYLHLYVMCVYICIYVYMYVI